MQEKDKIAFSGSHPDSLFRVAMEPHEDKGLAGRLLRVVRWPAALLAVCFALALFIYYVMPNSKESSLADGNRTVWEGALAGQFRHRPEMPIEKEYAPPNAPFKLQPHSNASEKGFTTGPKEIDFEKAFTKLMTDETTTEDHQEFSSTILPEVKYGNEERPRPGYHGPQREPTIIPSPTYIQEESTLKSYTKEGKGEFAILVTEDDVNLSTEVIALKNSTVHLKTQPPDTNSELGVEQNDSRSIITSGHSKVFGISIEEAERLATTPSSLYHTRVSPTLPPMSRSPDKYSISTTTWRSTDDDLSCRSSQIKHCRHLLPYDLVQSLPNLPFKMNERETQHLLNDFKNISISDHPSPCMKRILTFLCYTMEPECTPDPHMAKKPCKKFCTDVLETECQGNFLTIPLAVKALFECNNYPEEDCVKTPPPCLDGEMTCSDGTCVPQSRRCDDSYDCPDKIDEQNCDKCNDTHWRCSQGDCVPMKWLCDGYADCPSGDDEFRCRAGPDGFLPHPIKVDKSIPSWLTELVGKDNPLAESIASGSMVRKYLVPALGRVDPRAFEFNNDKVPQHDKGDVDSQELLMTSDSSRAPVRPYLNKQLPRLENRNEKIEPGMELKDGPGPNAADVHLTENEETSMKSEDAKLEKLLTDLETIVDNQNFWEQLPESEPVELSRESSSSHTSPCPAGELRCVDGRCIMFSQLCDGRVDCSDNADEENCRA